MACKAERQVRIGIPISIPEQGCTCSSSLQPSKVYNILLAGRKYHVEALLLYFDIVDFTIY